MPAQFNVTGFAAFTMLLLFFAAAGSAADTPVRSLAEFKKHVCPLERGAVLAQNWRLLDYRAQSADSVSMDFQSLDGKKIVRVFVRDHRGGKEYFLKTPSFYLHYGAASAKTRAGPGEARVLMRALEKMILKNDHGGWTLKLDVATERRGERREAVFTLPFAAVFLIMLALCLAVCVALHCMIPAPQRRWAVFALVLAAAVVTRFFVPRELPMNNNYVDYQTYIRAAGDVVDPPQDVRMGNIKPTFLFQAVMNAVGFDIRNLMCLARFLGAVMIVATYLLGLVLFDDWRIGATGAGLLAACPGHLLVSADITLHLPAATFFLVSLFSGLAATRKNGLARDLLLLGSFLLMCLGALQKIDFFYFPFFYFFTLWAVWPGKTFGGRDIVRAAAFALVAGGVTLALLAAADARGGLNVFMQAAGGQTGKFLFFSDYPALRTLFYIFLNTVVPFLLLPPVLPFKILALIFVVNKRFPLYARLLAVGLVGIFLLQYTPTHFDVLDEKIERAAVVAPFLYLGAGAVLWDWAARSAKRPVALALIAGFTLNVFFYFFAAGMYAHMPKKHDYQLLISNRNRLRGCVVLYTDYPRVQTPYLPLAAQNPAANLKPLPVSQILNPDSQPFRDWKRMDRLLRGDKFKKAQFIPDARQSLAFYRDFFLNRRYRYEPGPPNADAAREEMARILARVPTPGAYDPGRVFQSDFLQMRQTRACIYFFEDSFTQHRNQALPLHLKTEYALRLLPTEIADSLYQARLHRLK